MDLPFSRPLNLDLAFNEATESLLENITDESAISLLTESESWQKDIKNWIQFLRSDYEFPFSELIRNVSSVSLGIEFMNDEAIAELNAVWRDIPHSTDVLSFPVLDRTNEYQYPIDECLELGDIIVSVPTAVAQAIDQKHSLEKELKWLVSHGFLHLLGWDHPNPIKLKEMLACQEQLLEINGNLSIDRVLTLLNH